MRAFYNNFDAGEEIGAGPLGFVHKRIGGAIKGGLTSLITGGNPLGGAVGGFIGGGGVPATQVPTMQQIAAASPGKFTAAQLQGTRDHLAHGHGRGDSGHSWMTAELVAASQCSPGFHMDASGICVSTGSPGDISTGVEFPDQYGAAVIGRFGTALQPAQHPTVVRRCPPGAVLGRDNLCYDKLRNSERKWPKGKAPLLTGGQMNAISIAARAASKLERTTKRLQKIGLMKKPSKGARRITSGPTQHHHHD